MIHSTWVSPGIEPGPRQPKESARPLDHQPDFLIFQPKVASLAFLTPNFLTIEEALYYVHRTIESDGGAREDAQPKKRRREVFD